MDFYEATNGFIGFSYVRVYVWAKDEKTAKKLAKEAFKRESEGNKREYANITISHLFASTAGEFVTEPDDGGFELDKLTRKE